MTGLIRESWREGVKLLSQNQSGLINCYDVFFISLVKFMGQKQTFESTLVSRCIILASTVMPPACELFLVTFFFLAEKGLVQMQVHGPKRGLFRSVIVFLCSLWYPACISRQAFANMMCLLQVKVFLIQVYQKSVFYHWEGFIISVALRGGSCTDPKSVLYL